MLPRGLHRGDDADKATRCRRAMQWDYTDNYYCCTACCVAAIAPPPRLRPNSSYLAALADDSPAVWLRRLRRSGVTQRPNGDPRPGPTLAANCYDCLIYTLEDETKRPLLLTRLCVAVAGKPCPANITLHSRPSRRLSHKHPPSPAPSALRAVSARQSGDVGRDPSILSRLPPPERGG